MGDRHKDPTDYFRTTQPHAGLSMKDNLFWPGFILLGVGMFGIIFTAAAAGYHHGEWLPTTGLVSVLGIVAGALWLVVEHRRVVRLDEQWRVAHPDKRPTQRVR
ncbi:MAG: UsfY protein [Mycobacterium sp.]|nr:UsfY protein [Mycobacterium sp.]